MNFRSLIKSIILQLNDATLRTRFSFDADYGRWRRRASSGVVTNEGAQVTGKAIKIAYLVPGVAISGGIAVVLQHANRLKQEGYDVAVLSLAPKNDTSWFPNQDVAIFSYKETRKLLESGSLDVLIATGYSTAFSVMLAKARRKIYFVQSDESRFFPENPKLCGIIKETYTLPMEYMTEAKWIQKWLKDEFGKDAHYVPNGIDLEVFKKTKPIVAKTNKPRVLIEGAIDVPYKGMDDAYAAVKDLDCELWIVSNNGKPRRGWRYDKFFENVPYGEMAKIYSSCDIFLKMSRIEGFFGPPMEAMACGCAVVVGKVTGCDEYIEHEKNALVVEQGDVQAAKKAIQRLIEDKKMREKLIEGGYETAQKWGWNRTIECLLDFVIKNKSV